jgi:tetratricopeptide (TPR) repeat protein
MINKKINIIVVLGLIVIIFLLGLQVVAAIYKKPIQKSTIVTGLSSGQATNFQSDLKNAMAEYQHIQIGYKLMQAGDVDKAVEEFLIALSLARGTGEKGEAYRALANAYEKKKDYAQALEYIVIERDKYIADWAKESLVERAKYLEYAINGEYDLAVAHAEKAIDADTKINNSDITRQDYQSRLNDLKAAESYIRSLKKQQQ